ncbi:hypothetical protein K7432_009085 [Basidiobolus ranarum]|uniref:PH domain-containing protein n=1 Tax=Basidiobolus ranarum TaxID=34480 RepID=A0ABR2WQU0_9FUNG
MATTDNTAQVTLPSDQEQAPIVDTVAPTEDLVHTTDATAQSNEVGASETQERIQEVSNGILFKRGPRPLRLWKNRYFAFHSEPIPLAQLRLVSKKYTKAISAGKEEFEKVNRSLFHDIASATVSGQGLLFYYKSNSPDHVEVPLGIVNLSDVESVAPIKASKPYSFAIKTHAREYVLAAPNADEAKAWIHTVQTRLDSLSTLANPAETPQYKEIYEQLVSREAFNPKTTPPLPTGILSDTEVLSGSDNENEPRSAESQAAEAPNEEAVVAAEEAATEEAPAVADISSEVQSDSPKRKSMFGNFKSFINKKSDKPADATPLSPELSEGDPQAADQTASEALPETAELAVPETSEQKAVSTEVPTAEVKKDEHPSRPLSFHIPKFFKGPKKEDKHEAIAEAAEAHPTEAEHATDISTTEAVGAAQVEGDATTATETHEGQPAESARPASPFKRTFSNFLHLKKNKQPENPNDPADVEIQPPVSETDNLEKPLDIVDNTTSEVATPPPSEPTPDAVNEEAAADDATDKPKKPTLFKRLSLMVRSNTAPKGAAQPAADVATAPAVVEEPISESHEERTVEEAVKAN